MNMRKNGPHQPSNIFCHMRQSTEIILKMLWCICWLHCFCRVHRRRSIGYRTSINWWSRWT